MDNPICSTTILSEFIIYRFPKIKKINEIEIDENENNSNRKKARLLFENFDQILQLPEKMPKSLYWTQKNADPKKKSSSSKPSSMKQINRSINETSEKFLSQILYEVQSETKIQTQFEKLWDNYINSMFNNNLISLNKK